MKLISMRWSENTQPLAVGTNVRKLKKAALQKMRKEFGNGPVNRGSAMCLAPITYGDFEIEEVEVV